MKGSKSLLYRLVLVILIFPPVIPTGLGRNVAFLTAGAGGRSVWPRGSDFRRMELKPFIGSILLVIFLLIIFVLNLYMHYLILFNKTKLVYLYI